jgi:ribosomal protein S18 acetylase RimI-like enzyme
MNFEEELDIYLRARFTLLVLMTQEEERALETIKVVSERTQRPCLTWDIADGFQALTDQEGSLPAAPDPKTALEKLDKAADITLFVLKDFHEFWDNPQIKRKLRNLAHSLRFTKKSILVTSPARKIPEELRDEAVVVEFPSPQTSELEDVLNRLAQTPGVKVNLTELGRDKLVQAALGLSALQAQRVFAKAIVRDDSLDDRDIDLVTEEKKQVIRESEALEFYAAPEAPIFVRRRYAVIDNVVVKKKFRRAGVGRALVEKAHEWAVAEGADSIELNVWEFNREAIEFYRTLGYETTSRKMSRRPNQAGN